jgi:signal transduction histidine kinase
LPEPDFARLVSLAAHDLRTPLATVQGFAKTLLRTADLPDPAPRYLGIVDEASDQLAEILELLGLAARIEGGRYDPVAREEDSLALAVAAAELGGDAISASGSGAAVLVDVDAVARSLSHLAVAALRHGGVEAVELRVAGNEIRVGPVVPGAAGVVLGEELKDLGAAVAIRLVRALGGTAALDGDELVVVLPAPV